MKYLVAAFAIAVATPAAAQPAAHQGHGQHQQGGQTQHQGHGQHGQGQNQGHGQQGQHQGHGESCPCCAPGPNGQRPPCCERMMQQGSQQGAAPTGGHDNH